MNYKNAIKVALVFIFVIVVGAYLLKHANQIALKTYENSLEQELSDLKNFSNPNFISQAPSKDWILLSRKTVAELLSNINKDRLEVGGLKISESDVIVYARRNPRNEIEYKVKASYH